MTSIGGYARCVANHHRWLPVDATDKLTKHQKLSSRRAEGFGPLKRGQPTRMGTVAKPRAPGARDEENHDLGH